MISTTNIFTKTAQVFLCCITVVENILQYHVHLGLKSQWSLALVLVILFNGHKEIHLLLCDTLVSLVFDNCTSVTFFLNPKYFILSL